MRRRSLLLLVAWLLVSGGCDSDESRPAEREILDHDAPRVAEILRDDLARHRVGLKRLAARIAPGFVKVEGEQQEKDMRVVLKLARKPKKGISELVISPLSFLAAVGADGVVIARDAKPDHMKGMNLAEDFPVVERALGGQFAEGIEEFQSLTEGGKPSVTLLMAAPSRYDGKVVGAAALGIPLRLLSQRLSRQLQAEGVGDVVWVYIYRGDELHHFGTPPDLDQIVADAATRRAGLAKSPGGFTGGVEQFGYWYGYGVLPVPMLGEDMGVIIMRMVK